MAAAQLSFPFATQARHSAEDFVVSDCNREAHSLISLGPESWSAYGLVLTGPAASGKTHLAAQWAALSSAAFLEPALLTEKFSPILLPPHGRVIVENAEQAPSAEALLHLLNLTKEQGGALLLTSRLPPSAWPFTLPDLRSRLNALPLAELRTPDDALLSALIAKLFSDRQLIVPAELTPYLLARSERSFAGIHRTVVALDRAAMEQKHRITLKLARQVLEAEIS